MKYYRPKIFILGSVFYHLERVVLATLDIYNKEIGL